MNYRVALLRTVCLLSIAMSAREAHAQFAIDKTEISLNPRDSLSRTAILLVRNEGAERSQANIKIEDWDRAEDGTNRFYTAGSHPKSCAKGLSVFPLSVTLSPGESQSIRITYDPKKAGVESAPMPRECWSVVLVEHLLPRPASDGRTLYYTLRTGAKVYVEPTGLTKDGQVADVSVRESAPGKEEIEVAFENTGTTHVIAKGRLEFRRADNTTAATVDLPLAYVLPGATGRVKAVHPSLPKGKYLILAVMDYGGQELAAAQLEHEAR